MADTATTARAGGDNPFAPILNEADTIQALAGRMGHLARAIERMGDDLCGRTTDRHDVELVRGIVSFAEIACEMARQIGDAGERVEMATNQARRA